jgi:hypothetical protein
MTISWTISQIVMNLTKNKKFKMIKAQIAKWIIILLPKKLIKILITKKTKRIILIDKKLR